jgi:HPt (histidine-containing phosphotransfer) domain-containing protein
MGLYIFDALPGYGLCSRVVGRQLQAFRADGGTVMSLDSIMSNQLLQPAEAATAPTPSYKAAMPLDFPQLVKRCLGNVALAERLLSNFEQRFETELSRLRDGMQAQNSQLVARVAHQLKGAAANLAAGGLQQISAEIEQRGRADRWDEVDALLVQLRHEWHRFTEYRISQGHCN